MTALEILIRPLAGGEPAPYPLLLLADPAPDLVAAYLGEGLCTVATVAQSTVTEVLVDPDYRRQGIGRRLMELAWDLSPTALQFGVQPGNGSFFEKLGFEPTLMSYGKRKPRPVPSDL